MNPLVLLLEASFCRDTARGLCLFAVQAYSPRLTWRLRQRAERLRRRADRLEKQARGET